jgi:hypothetical protein
MPFWIAKHSAKAVWKRIPWTMVWAISVWLVKKGRERVDANLTKKERSELVNLVAKSKGRPGNLPQRDKTRLKHIAEKAVRG